MKNVLEDALPIVLVKAEKQKRKKNKTDFRDAISLGHQHRHGMLTGSYLPERGIVELRDLTRRRKKVLGTMTSEKNRIQKILETANVKIGNVVSNVFGISGQDMLSALLSKQPASAEQLAEMTRGRLRVKMGALALALEDHCMNDHQRVDFGRWTSLLQGFCDRGNLQTLLRP